MNAPLIIAPSILSANFKNLSEEIISVENAGADWHHFDVMDGHFVPNLSFGPGIQKHVDEMTDRFIDSHLMVTHPRSFLKPFADAGSDNITIHVECEDDVEACLKTIKDMGLMAGITLRPGTPVDELEPFITFVDLVLVMTVEPGFGGQSFLPEMVQKVQWLHQKKSDLGLGYHIEVDGGINATTGKACVDAGANVLVAGNYIYGAEDHKSAIASLQLNEEVGPC